MTTLLVHTNQDSMHKREFQTLCGASDAALWYSYRANVRTLSPHTHLGTGHVDFLGDLIKQHKVKQVFFDCDLKPTIQRNLEKRWCTSVIDRSEIILDLFARHARTYEGKLQVEWAQLQRLSTRLVRGWTHLERQKGGIGLRGPGEKQLETDRRLIQKRIEQINKKLKKIIGSRKQNRQARVKQQTPVVGLIGYTNVGKSTLFNQLTQSKVFCADQPFATLDPTIRKVNRYPYHFILMDTVGFINNLPKELLAGFRATLEEIKHADLLVHVMDATQVLGGKDEACLKEVEKLLTSIDAHQIPRLYFYNKVDELKDSEIPPSMGLRHNQSPCIWGSALCDTGIELLLQNIQKMLTK